MMAEEAGQSHRFSELVEQFPKDISLDKFLFQDESLLWAQKLPLQYRFRSLGVMLCLLFSGAFILLDIIILAVGWSDLGLIVASLPLPLIVLPLHYAIHRLRGSQVQVVTNYRVMQCTVKYNSFFIRSLTYNCISGLTAQGSTIEFSIKEDDRTIKKSSELRNMVFRGIENVSHVETIVQRQLHSSLSEFQYPPNIETEHVHLAPLLPQYRALLPEIEREPASLLWVSVPSFFQSHRSLIINTLLAEGWIFCLFFTPALASSSLLHQAPVKALVSVFVLTLPVVMIIFNPLKRVDVLTTSTIAMFSYRATILGFKPQVELLDYKDAFPHSIEISTSNGSGTINLENVSPKGVPGIEWPDVLVREELIFRKHCLAYGHNNSANKLEF